MLEVKPFAAIRYSRKTAGSDLSNLLAPPYDVLDQADKERLLAVSDHNIVAIDLPHIPPKSLGPQGEYDRSNELLQSWLADGTLEVEDKPALYIYHQTFTHQGQTFTRKKFIARVRIQAFDKGVVLPHEQTFGGPKEDRLALMKATRCNLSPIFGLYSDPANAIGEAFGGIENGKPDVTAVIEGVENRMWVCSEETVLANVGKLMADKRLYIADGHHRYGTALNYRNWLAEQNGGSLPEDHPAQFCMFVLASMDDPGCIIFPYNRALMGVDAKTLIEAWGDGAKVVDAAPVDLVLYDGRSKSETKLRFSNRGILKQLEPDQCDAWHQLDAAYLHRYLIDMLLKQQLGKDPVIRYVKSSENARSAAESEGGVALLVNATPMDQLQGVSEAAGLMPQKSTYFYPKLATGLTMNRLHA